MSSVEAGERLRSSEIFLRHRDRKRLQTLQQQPWCCLSGVCRGIESTESIENAVCSVRWMLGMQFLGRWLSGVGGQHGQHNIIHFFLLVEFIASNQTKAL